MTSLDDFLNKKKGSSTGTASSNSGGGTGMDDFFRKKKEKEIVSQPDTTTPTDSKVEESFDLSKLPETKPINVLPASQDPNMTNIGPGTLSTGQGVHIDRTNMEKQMKMDDDEKLRVKQADLVMGAEQMGEMFIKDLSEQDKDLMIAGLKNKEASITYQEAGKSYQKQQEKDKLQGMLKGYGVDVTPKLEAVDPTKPTYTTKDIIANKDTGNIPFLAEMKKEDRDKYIADLQALGPERNPYNPDDFAYFEKKRQGMDMEFEGKKILAESKTAVDDPMENVSIALNIGRDQVNSTIGAIGEWMGVSDGTYRKEAEKNMEWESLKFNKNIDDEGSNASIFDSRFWTQKVPQSIPFMVALLPAGIAGAAAGGEIAAAAGMGTIGTYLMSAGFAGLTSRFAESITEGAGVYAELKDRGVDDETASKYAWSNAADNMKLVFSDIGQMAVTFAPVRKIPGLNTLIGRVAVPTAKFAFDATSEGGEEVFQGHVQQYNTKLGLGEKPMGVFEYLQTDEAREVFKLGAASGLAFGGLGVAKDAYDNFTDRTKAQVEMVQKAVEKNDIDFIPKMEILKDKGAISEQTVGAAKTLLSLKLNEKTGQTYDQWVQAGNDTRKQKIEETAASLKDLGAKIEEERKNASPEKMDFKNAKELSSYFQEKTGDTIELAKTKIAGVEMRNRMRANGNPVGETPTLEMEHIPYSKDQIKLIKKHQDLAKKSKNLFHTTTPENIQSIVKEGLQTGKAKRYDVSKEGKLYFSANEEAAKYFGSDKDVMIRVAKGYKFNDLGADILGGDGTYETTDNVPPEYLEVKKGGKWVPIKEAYKEDTAISKKETPDTTTTEKPEDSKKEVSKQDLAMMKRDYNNYQELYKTRGDERYKADMEKELEKIRQVEPEFGKAQEPMQEEDIGKVVDGLSESEKSDLEADYVFGSKDERTIKIGEEIKRRRLAEYEVRKEEEMGKIQKEWRDSKQEGTYDEFVIEKMKELNEEYKQGMYELGINIETSQAGYRQFVYNTDAPGSTITGVSSSFPNWIPEHLRIKKLMEETYEYLANNMIIPQRNTRMRELADVFMQHLDPKLYIYGDEQGQNLKGTPIRKELAKPAESTAGKNNEGNPGNENGSTPESNDANNESSNQDGSTTGRAKEEQTGTSKTGIVNALKKVDELVKTESVPEVSKEEKMLMKELMGIDMDLVDFQNKYVSEKIGKPFVYNMDLSEKYDDEIKGYLKDAKEKYENKTIEQKVEEELNKDEKNKEFKDVGERVAGSKKENAKYKVISQDDLSKLEGESEVQAFNLVTKDRVVQDPYDPIAGRDAGEDAGIAYFKTKLWSSIQKKPENNKDSRSSYLRLVTEISGMIKEARSLEQLQVDLKQKFKKMHSRKGFGYFAEGHDIELGNNVLGQKFFNLVYGSTDASWQVTKDAVQKYRGRTQEMAIEQGKKELEHLGFRLEYAEKALGTIKETDSRYKGSQMNIEMLKQAIAKYENPEVKEDNWEWLDGKRKESEKDTGNLPKEEGKGIGLHDFKTIESIIRTGGRQIDITYGSNEEAAMALQDNLGFKSAQFGNYVKDIERKDFIEQTIGAVYDLEDALEIDIVKLNRDAGLSIAFGARGGGKFAAHFESDHNIINLTKRKGAGSYGHEWGHFFDNAIGKLDKKDPKNFRYFLSESSEAEKEKTKMDDAIIGVLDAMKNGEGTRQVVAKKTTGRRYMPQIREAYKTGGIEAAMKKAGEMVEKKKAVYGSRWKLEDSKKIYSFVADEAKVDFVKFEEKTGKSEYFESAYNLDKGKSGYWSSNVELFARAFEGYIHQKLIEKGMTSNFLVDEEKMNPESDWFVAYPQGEERVKINAAFDKLFEEYKKQYGEKKYDENTPRVKYQSGDIVIDENIDSSLIREARKYNTIEEFINYLGSPLYHGTSADATFTKFKGKEAWFTDIKATAKGFSEDKSFEMIRKKGISDTDTRFWDEGVLKNKVYEAYLFPKKNLTVEAYGRYWDDINTPEEMGGKGIKTTDQIARWARNNGYDSVTFNEIIDGTGYRPEKNIVVFDHTRTRIKSEIEEIYKKAHSIREQGSESNTWIYDIVGSQYKTHPYSKQKIDISESYKEAMKLAPDGWKVRVDDATIENSLKTQDGAEMVAYADLENKVIMINKNEARKSTAAHESVHAHLSEIGDKERRQILNAGKKQWEGVSGKSLNDNQVEEFIAEEFKYFIENKKYKTKTLLGKLREFIASLANRIKGVFGKDDKIKSFYEGILSGKLKAEGTNIGKKYQSAEDWRAREKEEYDKIDAENFGYKLPPKLGPEFQKSEAEKVPGKTWVSFKEFGSKALVPLDSLIGSVSKTLKDRLIKFEYGVGNSDIMKEVRPVMEKMFDKIKDKKKTDEYRILDIALKNGNDEVMQYYADKLGISEEMKEVRKILDKIYEEAGLVGLDVKYREKYFPRTIKDSIGLLTYIYKTEFGSKIKEAIFYAEREAGHELTDEEKAVIANKMLMGWEVNGITLTPPGNTKARQIEKVTQELNPFYNDSMDSLVTYVAGMNEQIEARKLFGKGENLEDSIGSFMMDLIIKGEISAVDEARITRALKARFKKTSMDAWVQGYKGISYLTTMGSPISALSQIQDLGFSLYENGFYRTGTNWGKAMVGKSKISVKDLGIENIAQEFKEPGKIQKAVSTVFKWVGLSYMDRVGKETMINGAYRKMQKEVLSGNLRSLRVLDPEAQARVAEELRQDLVSDDIKYILFTKLCQYQPLTASQMPEYYNTSGNMRAMYMLKTYLVKQIDVIRQESVSDMMDEKLSKKERTLAFGRLMKIAACLMLMGMAADALKNLILNRPFKLEDMVIDNVLKLMGFSKYTVYQVKTKSLSEGLLAIVLPPFNFFNDPIQDYYYFTQEKQKDGEDSGEKLHEWDPTKLQTINDIPIGGKLFYWWFGRGAEKSDKKRDTGTAKAVDWGNPFAEDSAFKQESLGFGEDDLFK